MTKITIKKILNKEKISKAGKPYKSCSILTIDKNGQEVWLNSFANSTTESWKDGDTVDLEIEKTDYGYKFKEPKEISLLDVFNRMNEIISKLDLLTAVKEMGGTIVEDRKMNNADFMLEQKRLAQEKYEEIDTSNIPF